MKARVKATGEIVDLAPYTRVCEDFAKGRSWLVEELDDADDGPDYWTSLEHQYAGMAMQGICSSDIIMEKINMINVEADKFGVLIAELSANLAHALVEKMKEERK